MLDVGSTVGSAVGDAGCVAGVDNTEDSIETGQRRCSGLAIVGLHLGDAVARSSGEATFDAAISMQPFECLLDVRAALAEVYRVLKPGGRVLIHDIEWDAGARHSSDRARMNRIMEVWDYHLDDLHLPRTQGPKLTAAEFTDVRGEPVVRDERGCPGGVRSVSASTSGRAEARLNCLRGSTSRRHSPEPTSAAVGSGCRRTALLTAPDRARVRQTRSRTGWSASPR